MRETLRQLVFRTLVPALAFGCLGFNVGMNWFNGEMKETLAVQNKAIESQRHAIQEQQQAMDDMRGTMNRMEALNKECNGQAREALDGWNATINSNRELREMLDKVTAELRRRVAMARY